MPSYSTPQHQQYSKTELASSQAPCPQPRPDSFQFPSLWTPQERCKRPSICGRWWDERHGAWLLCNQPKNFFSSGIKKFAVCWAKWMKKRRLHWKVMFLMLQHKQRFFKELSADTFLSILCIKSYVHLEESSQIRLKCVWIWAVQQQLITCRFMRC